MMPEEQASLLEQVRAQATPAACRRFAVTLLAGLPAAGLVWLLLLRWSTHRWMWPVPAGFMVAGLVLGGSVLLAPAAGRRLYIAWHAVTRTIELALTWIVLGLVFWLVITPVGLIRRGRSRPFRVDPRGPKSCWHDVPPVKDPVRYYRQF